MPARLKRLTASEEEVQRGIVTALTALGYLVLVTSRRPKRCWNCGQWGKSGTGDGVSKGLPDLFFSRREWRNRWYGAEIKSATGRLRPEQKILAESGMVFVWRSIDDALKTLQNLSN